MVITVHVRMCTNSLSKFAFFSYIDMMTFIPNAWSLAFWRFLLGIVSAGLLPAAQTVLTLNVPPEAFGRVFSYNQSFQAVGAVLGSLLGSTISGMFTYEWVFAETGITLLINYLIMQLSAHHQNA